MKEHPDKWKLERYLGIGKPLSAGQKEEISDHIDDCHYCAERIEILTDYHQQIEEKLNQPTVNKNESYKNRVFNPQEKDLLPSQSLVETYGASLEPSRRLLPTTLLRYIRYHPVRPVLAAAASILLIATLVFKPWEDQNPVYAKVDKNILRVLNDNGEMLWKMSAEGISEGVSSKEPQVDGKGKEYIKLANIDNKAGNELLISGDNMGSRFAVDTLYCYNGDGSLRWKQGVGAPPQIQEPKNANIGWWKIYNVFVLQLSNQAKPRLYVLANAGRWSPSTFYEIEASTGAITQSYWHDGHLQTAALLKGNSEKDSDRLILGAINGFFDRASLAVLNPDSIGGIGTSRGLYQDGAAPKANEKVYMTFKPSILTELYQNAPYNQVKEIIPANNGNLIIQTYEGYSRLGPNQGGSIYYVLDNNFKVVDVYGGDSFLKRYADLYKQGDPEIPAIDEYWQQLKDSVQYWDGEKFVNGPVKND